MTGRGSVLDLPTHHWGIWLFPVQLSLARFSRGRHMEQESGPEFTTVRLGIWLFPLQISRAEDVIVRELGLGIRTLRLGT
jgi:hypothetical protein